MARLTLSVVALLALGLIASCESTGSIPNSSIYIVDVDSERVLATARTPGDLTLTEGDTLFLMIERLVKEGTATHTSDVTTVSAYTFIPEGIATANDFGALRAVNQGTTRLEVRFRPSDFDEADRVYLNIRVD